MLANPIIFSGNANRGLAEKIANYLKRPLGNAEISYFSDGEIWVKYNQNIRGADVFVVQPTHSPERNLLELLIMIDAARRASAERIAAVIPYFGYARQDRKDHHQSEGREIGSARHRRLPSLPKPRSRRAVTSWK